MSHELKNSTGKTTGGIGAEDFSKIASQISGEDHVPDAPSMALLGLLAMIRKTDNGTVDAWTPMIDNELRHLKAAVTLLRDNPVIQNRFGTSMEGAMQLVGLIKARAAELEVTEMIDPIIETHIQPTMASKNFKTDSVFKAFRTKADNTYRGLYPTIKP